MEATLIQPSRVQDDSPMGRKLLLYGTNRLDLLGFDGTIRISTGYSVPAAAVIRRVQALSGITGFKGCVGGLISQK